MINISQFIQEKPSLPVWFKDHPIFQEVKSTVKIFPQIGLPNFSEEISSSFEPEKGSYNSMAYRLVTELCAIIQEVSNHFRESGASSRKTLCQNFLNAFIDELDSYEYDVAFSKSGFHLHNDIKIGTEVFLKKGEGLFKAYNKAAHYLEHHYGYSLPKLETLVTFKEFSSGNVTGKYNIVFSSDGIDGAWDIMTMSMRGISSCQTWTNEIYSRCSIGSLLDPFTGIIYLTSGSKLEHGTRMIRRCIVRFVVDKETREPAIFLEKMYPNLHKGTERLFLKLLKEKTKDQIKILNTEYTDNHFVPFSEVTKYLTAHSNPLNINKSGWQNKETVFPYRDTFVIYKLEPVSTLSSIDPAIVPKELKTVLEKANLSSYYIKLCLKVLDSEVFSKIDQSCLSLPEVKKKFVIIYLSHHRSIQEKLTAEFAEAFKTTKDKTIFVPGFSNPRIKSELTFLDKTITSFFKNSWKKLLKKTK